MQPELVDMIIDPRAVQNVPVSCAWPSPSPYTTLQVAFQGQACQNPAVQTLVPDTLQLCLGFQDLVGSRSTRSSR